MIKRIFNYLFADYGVTLLIILGVAYLSINSNPDLMYGRPHDPVENYYEAMKPPPIEMKKVSSTFIDCIGYDGSRGLLYVKFKDGNIYRYYEVPEDIYNGILSASSNGRYFNKYIKNVYECERVNRLKSTGHFVFSALER